MIKLILVCLIAGSVGACDDGWINTRVVGMCPYGNHMEHISVNDFCDDMVTWIKAEAQALGDATATITNGSTHSHETAVGLYVGCSIDHSHDNQYIERIDTMWCFLCDCCDSPRCCPDHTIKAPPKIDTTWADKPELYILSIDTLCMIAPWLDSTECNIYDTTWVDYYPLKLTKKQADWFMEWLENQIMPQSHGFVPLINTSFFATLYHLRCDTSVCTYWK